MKKFTAIVTTILLLFLTTCLSAPCFAGRIGWSFALFSKNADGSLRFKRTHFTMDGCLAHKNLYYADRPDLVCLKFR